MIERCASRDAGDIRDIINDAARAYRGVIASDRWHEPYMGMEELNRELAAGVVFWGWYERGKLEGVMGLQGVKEVALIRHAYTRTAAQGRGIGSELLAHLVDQTDRSLLVGTWKAATWAVQFYERRGFRLAPEAEKIELLRTYWTVPERQIEESVVLRY